jgi:ABC-type amino acid transport substrate-binding protein
MQTFPCADFNNLILRMLILAASAAQPAYVVAETINRALSSSSPSITAPYELTSKSKEEITKKRKLSSCIFEWKPYSYHSSGQLTGIIIDLLQQIEQTLALEITYTTMPPKRCISEARLGNYDLIPYLDDGYDFMILTETPVQYLIEGFVVPDESQHKRFHTIEQFSGQAIGVFRGLHYDAVLQSNTLIQWYKTNNLNSMRHMLQGKRLDAYLGDLPTLIPGTGTGNKKFRFLYPPIRTMPLRMGFLPRYKDKVEAINQELTELIENGTVNQLYITHNAMSFNDIMLAIKKYKNVNPDTDIVQ